MALNKTHHEIDNMRQA